MSGSDAIQVASHTYLVHVPSRWGITVSIASSAAIERSNNGDSGRRVPGGRCRNNVALVGKPPKRPKQAITPISGQYRTEEIGCPITQMNFNGVWDDLNSHGEHQFNQQDIQRTQAVFRFAI